MDGNLTTPTLNINFNICQRFTTKLDDDDFGDLVLTIPYEICEELGWYRETELEYDIIDGEITFKKLEDE